MTTDSQTEDESRWQLGTLLQEMDLRPLLRCPSSQSGSKPEVLHTPTAASPSMPAPCRTFAARLSPPPVALLQ